MREVKFRGRSINYVAANDSYWAYGLLVNDDPPEIECDDGDIYRVNDNTVGQYTGLEDSDGREIYEGDVIRVCGCNGIVVYSEGSFIVRFEKAPSLLSHCVGGDFSNPERVTACRVIGNIHDNPELLK